MTQDSLLRRETHRHLQGTFQCPPVVKLNNMTCTRCPESKCQVWCQFNLLPGPTLTTCCTDFPLLVIGLMDEQFWKYKPQIILYQLSWGFMWRNNLFEDLSDIFITFGINPTNMANIPVTDCFFLNYVMVQNSCAYKPRQILQIVNFKDTKRS